MSTVVGTPPSREEDFYLNWALESVKASTARLDEIMKQLLSLASGLLGIDLVFEMVAPGGVFKTLIALGCLVSMAFSFHGMLPVVAKVRPSDAAAVKVAMENALSYKKTRLYCSAFSLALSIGLTIGFLLSRIQ